MIKCFNKAWSHRKVVTHLRHPENVLGILQRSSRGIPELSNSPSEAPQSSRVVFPAVVVVVIAGDDCMTSTICLHTCRAKYLSAGWGCGSPSHLECRYGLLVFFTISLGMDSSEVPQRHPGVPEWFLRSSPEFENCFSSCRCCCCHCWR